MDGTMPPSPSRELIPWSSDSRQVYFRHKDSVVIFDPEKDRHQQLTASRMYEKDRIHACPLCRRPFTDAHTRSDPKTSGEDDLDDTTIPDVNPGYFRMLAQSRHVSPQTSAPSTPRSTPRGRLPSLPDLGERPQVGTPKRSRLRGYSSSRISSSAFTQGYFERFFVQERELGRGGKATVILVRHELDGVFLGRFACKRIPVGDDRKWLENVLMEVTLLQDISHKNLVAYRHVWLEDYQPSLFGPKIPHLYILQQYCNAGTLFQHVLGKLHSPFSDRATRNPESRRLSQDHHAGYGAPQRLGFEEVLSFFKDIATGLAYLHSHGFVHRDLKPQNCLLHRADGSLRALVSDFGEMQRVTAERGPSATGYTGTISFSAPEVVMRGSDGTFGDFTPRSDVFSLGMIVYFMCFARLPYTTSDHDMCEDNEDVELLRAEISAWPGFDTAHRERDDLPEKLYRYLRTLLSRDPEQRPTTDAILHAIKGGSSFNEHITTSNRSPSVTPVPNPDSSSPVPPGGADALTTIAPNRYLIHRSSRRGSTASPNLYAFDHARSANNHEGSPASPQLLLPPPGNHTVTLKLMNLISKIGLSRQIPQIIRLLLFLLKTWSLLSPCASIGYNLTVLYPLLSLAAAELCFLRTVQSILAFTILHTAVLLALRQRNVLCLVPTEL